MAEVGPLTSTTAFCAKCGSILPLLQEFGSVKCYSCKAIYDAEKRVSRIMKSFTFLQRMCRLFKVTLKEIDELLVMNREVYGYANIKFNYTIHFNAVSTMTNENVLNKDGPEGPVVERRCPRCGNDRMSYATLQLRSADEGQTVFYTCVSCKYKETENS